MTCTVVQSSSTSSNFCCCCSMLFPPSTSETPSLSQNILDDQVDDKRIPDETRLFITKSSYPNVRNAMPIQRNASCIRPPGRLKKSSNKWPQNFVSQLKSNSLMAQGPLFHFALNSLLFLSFFALIISTMGLSAPAVSREQQSSRFSAEERQLLRGMFLKRFGLEALGDAISRTEQHQLWHNRAKRSTAAESETMELPRYIWDAYDEHSEGERQFETIRHYFPLAVKSTENGVQLTFNLSTTGRDTLNELVMKSNLRLPFPLHDDQTSKTYSRPVFDRIKVFSTGNTTADQEKFLLTTQINGDSSDEIDEDDGDQKWINFNVKEAFTGQTAGTSPDLIHFIVEHRSLQTDTIVENFGKSAALIVYVNSKNFVPSSNADNNIGRRRRKRSANASNESNGNGRSAGKSQRRHRKHRKHHHFGGASGHNNRDNGQRTQCRRSDLYVDFGELNWQDWIMAPVGYEAYQCRGRCSHPMPSHLNTTNHAIIQSLMHSIDPSSVPAPSCVPVQMSAISILYKDLNNVVVVKTYTDMKVDACGCH